DDHEHHRRQGVDPQCPFDLDGADREEVGDHHVRVLAPEPDLDERNPGKHHGDEQQRGGDYLGRSRSHGGQFRRMPAVGRRVTRPGPRVRGVRRMVIARNGIASRATCACADDGDRTRENTAQQGQKNDREVHRQPFMRLMSSTAIEPRLRKNTTRMASPIAASAAATVSTTSANTWPTRSPRKAENATKLMLTASRMSSIDIRMTMTFLRLMKMPTIPSVNRIAATVR